MWSSRLSRTSTACWARCWLDKGDCFCIWPGLSFAAWVVWAGMHQPVWSSLVAWNDQIAELNQMQQEMVSTPARQSCQQLINSNINCWRQHSRHDTTQHNTAGFSKTIPAAAVCSCQALKICQTLRFPPSAFLSAILCTSVCLLDISAQTGLWRLWEAVAPSLGEIVAAVRLLRNSFNAFEQSMQALVLPFTVWHHPWDILRAWGLMKNRTMQQF